MWKYIRLCYIVLSRCTTSQRNKDTNQRRSRAASRDHLVRVRLDWWWVHTVRGVPTMMTTRTRATKPKVWVGKAALLAQARGPKTRWLLLLLEGVSQMFHGPFTDRRQKDSATIRRRVDPLHKHRLLLHASCCGRYKNNTGGNPDGSAYKLNLSC